MKDNGNLNILISTSNSEKLAGELVSYKTEILKDKTSLLDTLSKNNYHVLIIEDDIESIGKIKTTDPRVEIILTAPEGEIDLIDALNSGATAFLPEPLDMPRLMEVLDNIRKSFELRIETGRLEKELTEKYTFAGIVARNPQMLDVISFMRRIAPYYRSLLINGETGTGKEVIAKALHTVGSNSGSPFVVANCGALVENLIESELFGHKKGAFTGAISDKTGLFEAAGEGVLVLDEIGEMPLNFQPHLLRVLENGEFRKVGSHNVLKAKCRVIALTNRNLDESVKEGKFREDLFFRLKRLRIYIPPLRERMDDLPLLSRHLLSKFNQRTGKRIYGISLPAQAMLMKYRWPGNVRELESVIEESAMLANESFIGVEDISSYIKETSAQNIDSNIISLEEMEKRHIESALRLTGGNRTKAAVLLGLTRRSFLRRLDKFDIK